MGCNLTGYIKSTKMKKTRGAKYTGYKQVVVSECLKRSHLTTLRDLS